MKIRADIAGLIRAGHTDQRIARQLGCARSTVNRVRRALRLPPGDALERLYAEEAPAPVAEYKPGRTPISEHRAAANRAELAAAISPTPRPSAA